MATIKDVARASGVHISTVSRTFSAPHLVRAETRQRVLAAAAELGYRPNPAARGLITGRTHNIGLIVADVANPFFPPMIKAAEAQARQREYSVFIADSNEDPAVEADLVEALAKQVDGVLLCSPRMSDRLIRGLRAKVPVVVVNRRVKGIPGVLMDVAGGARRIVDHLADLGHRHILLLVGPSTSWTSGEIRRAATGAAAERGVTIGVLGPNDPTPDGGARLAEPVLRSGATAVLAYNDLMAVGLLQRLQEAGVRIPEDVSIVGVDNTLHSQYVRPRLTTLAMPTAAAGRVAVDLLLQIVADDRQMSAPLTVLDTSLVIRDSTAPPRPLVEPASVPVPE